MKKTPLKGMAIRTGLVVLPDIGYIYACDPKKEEKGVAHTYIFKWKAGEFSHVECEANLHAACVIHEPDYGRVAAAETGYYTVETRKGVSAGDIIEDSQPPAKKRRVSGFRSLSEIAKKAYAVGYQGMVYRLDELAKWTRIDEGLPDRFDIDAIDGFNPSDLYACGLKGALWHYSGRKWSRCDVPTDVNLNSIKCAEKVYVAGEGGVLICGREDTWKVVDHGGTEEDIWDLEWFEKSLYVSADDGLYRLERDMLVSVDFGKDTPKSFYQLSAAAGVMWSIGEEDIMSFDGKKWIRIV
jgi:hypothetical protein